MSNRKIFMSFLAVSSENKRDRRTIEEVMADTRARKKLKTVSSEDAVTSQHEETPTEPEESPTEPEETPTEPETS